MKQDLQIFELIKKERERQSQGLELIASENYVTDQVMEAMGSVCTNKYAEGYPGKRYYGGWDQIEQTAIDRLCELFDAEYANVQPHSGAQANLAVEMAVLSGCHDMSVLHRILEKARSDKSRSMGHVHPEQCAYFISYLSHPLIIPLSGICGSAADDKFRTMLFSQLLP